MLTQDYLQFSLKSNVKMHGWHETDFIFNVPKSVCPLCAATKSGVSYNGSYNELDAPFTYHDGLGQTQNHQSCNVEWKGVVGGGVTPSLSARLRSAPFLINILPLIRANEQSVEEQQLLKRTQATKTHQWRCVPQKLP